MRQTITQAVINNGRPLFGIFGVTAAYLQPTFPFMIVTTLAVLADCYTAWALSRRVMKKHPNANDGKFKSRYAGKVATTLIKIYALIILSYMIETFIFEGMPIRLSNIAAGAVCFWQIWSILENESSCNDARWARVAQSVMVDKAERHFDINLSELKKMSNEKNKEDDKRNRVRKDEGKL